MKSGAWHTLIIQPYLRWWRGFINTLHRAPFSLHSSQTLAKQCSKFSKLGFSRHEPRTSRCSSWISKRQRNKRSNCQQLLDHRKIKRIPEKTSTSALLTMPKPLAVWITTNCGKFLKRWEYQTSLPASWEACMQVKKQQLELDMEQQTGSK